MKYSVPDFDVTIEPAGFVIDLGSLYEHLATLTDSRHARGKRYALVTALVFIVLAKLAGEDRLFGISEWIKYRKVTLTEALHLAKPRVPHTNTYSRLLGKVVQVEEFERGVHDFFTSQPGAGQSIQICLDGKTLRGTIAAGQTRGLHLLAAFLPDEGWVICQMHVESKENEIVVAPQVLKCLDLRGKIVTGDALLAQRELSAQIVMAAGDYVWTVKENQPQLCQDIATLFAPEKCVKGFSPATHDFRTDQTTEKGHGRIEQRTLTVSAELKGYLDWPGAEQVFKLERRFERVTDGHLMHEVAYGITSLTAQEAGPRRLLDIVRTHWQIENGLHYRRDETLREDWCHLRLGHAPRAMAVINNLVLGLLLRQGVKNVPQARRDYAAHLNNAVALVLQSPR